MSLSLSELKKLPESGIKDYIGSFRKRNSGRVIIPAHHYVPASIIEFADFTGDSYKLAVEASRTDAQWIVFCGVHFMAEGVDILLGGERNVLVPEMSAGCPMAEMIDRELALKAIGLIRDFSGSLPAPVVYMNSNADAKSLCGEYDGSVCTSSNAGKILKYYLDKGKSVFFFPDQNLGRNIAGALGLSDDEIALVTRDFRLKHSSRAGKIKLYLWDGMCPVHHKFKKEGIAEFRKKYPGGKVIVHPEVRTEIASLSDMQGSTQKIFDVVKDSPEGSAWGIGTEHTFVKRLSEMSPGKTIVPLEVNICSNMNKNNLYNLAFSLFSIESFEKGEGDAFYRVNVEKQYRDNAKKALDKMIYIVEKR